MSLRLRLILWHSTLFSTCLAAFAIIVWVGTRTALQHDINNWLTRQGDGLERFILMETHGTSDAAIIEEAREFSTGLPQGSGLQLFDSEGTLLISRSVLAHGPTAGPTDGAFLGNEQSPIDSGSPIRTISGELSLGGYSYRYILWHSLDDADATLNRLGIVLIGMTPVFMLLSVAGGWFLSRKMLRPVDDVIDAARQIRFQNLSVSLPVPPYRDELQRLCLAFNELLCRLNESAKRLKQFTADASHELRTPLAVIYTETDLALRHQRSSDEYRASLARVREKCEDMTMTIEDLLHLARSDSGQLPFSLTTLNMALLLSEIREQSAVLSAGHEFQVVVQDPKDRLDILADPSSIRRLLIILIDNAIKFTRQPGRIEIRTRRSQDFVVVEVEDTGIGISQTDLPLIFDRFYQVDRSRSGRGSGLGLAIAKWIVEGHNGRIEVESTLGKGSVFKIWLPVRSK